MVQAERGRLARKRMRGKVRVLAVVAGVCVGLAIVVGAVVWAGHRYLPVLLAPPPPPPKPAQAAASQSDGARAGGQAEEAARPSHHKGSHATSPAADTPAEPPAPGDEQLPPSDGQQKP